MKKILAVLILLSLALGIAPVVLAEESSVSVFVTVSVAGEWKTVCKEVKVTDADDDGVLSISDAVYALHEAAAEGGALAGFDAKMGSYGLSLMKLWGDESGNFGYYLNHVSANSLADPVKDGDCLDAFVYQDTDSFSDVYCWFDQQTVSVESGKEITLTLTAAGYDESWNPITFPLAGAVITMDGEESRWVTDEKGCVTFTLPKSGKILIGAVSKDEILVPPVCVVTVRDSQQTQNPETGSRESGVLWFAMLFSLTALLFAGKKNCDEKKIM